MNVVESILNLVSRLIDKFGAWLLVSSIAFGLVLWFWLTPLRLARIHAEDIDQHRWMLLLLCCSLFGLLLKGLGTSSSVIRSRFRSREERRLSQTLHGLGVDHKMILRKFVECQAQGVLLRRSQFTEELCKKGILFERSRDEDPEQTGFSITDQTYLMLIKDQKILSRTFPTDPPRERYWWE